MADIDLSPDGPRSGPPSVPQDAIRRKSPALSDADFSALRLLIDNIKDSHDSHEVEPPEEDVAHVFGSFWRVVGIAGFVAIASSVSGGFAAYYGVKSDLQELHGDVKYNTDSIRAMREENEKIRLKYVPMIESADKVNDLQNNRFDSLVTSVTQLRDAVEVQRKEGAALHEDVAVMKNVIQLKLGAGIPNRN